MGAVKIRVQTANKNISVINKTPSINILWSEKLHVYNKQIYH